MGGKFRSKTRLFSFQSCSSVAATDNPIYDWSDKIRLLRLWICLLSPIWLSACATMGTGNAPDELARTFDEAVVAIPKIYFRLDASQGMPDLVYGGMKDVARDLAKISAEPKIPLIIYMHGCAAFSISGINDILFLGNNGYAVLAPNSFARKFKPISCNPSTYTGGLHRDVLHFRLAEARYAHEKVKSLPWVDQRNIFMMGFSEGGITTAQYDSGGLAARIILGWTCHSGWTEYTGISGPRDEPILAVVASRDPWFKDPSTWGDCGGTMAFRRKVESIVVNTDIHDVQSFPQIREKILQFLEANRRP